LKNKQGFLSNKLNKYAIRKFTVGTASLLIGATLVFGVGSEAKADELDKISSKDSTSNSDKGEALDIEDIKPVDDSQQTAKQEESTATSETADTDTTTQDTAQQSNENTKENNKADKNTTTSQDSEDTTQAQDNAKEQTASNNSGDKEQSDQKANSKNTTETDTTQDENTPSSEQQKDSTPEKATTTNNTHTDSANTNETDTKANTNNDENKNDTEKSNTTSDSNDKASTTEDNKKTTTTNTSDSLVKTIESNDVTDNKVDTKSNTSEVEDTTQENKSESVDESQLTKRLAASTDKETEVKDFLTDQLSAKDADAIMENADVDYSKDSVEDINLEILKASLIQLANKQKAAEPLATAPRTMLRAMATPTAFRAAVTQSEKVEKSLGYLDNYTFASLIFAPGALTGSTLDGNVIPFDIHSYMSGSNSGSRYKIDLKLDPLIADHVTKISVNPAGRSTPVVFTRLNDDDGNPSDIWEINFIRANGGLFGGAEILSQYSATNGKIELDDTLSNILKDAGDLSNNKLNYQIYVRDSEGNKIVKTSESSGYFLSSADSDLIQYENNISPENKSDFKASSGTAVYDDAPGEYGGFIIDQQIMKNGIFTYSKTKNKQWSYNYQIDKDLLPYIDSVELDTYDYQGLGGFDKTYNASNKVADLQIDSNGNGKITSDNLNKLIEFNNLTPETVGIRIVVKLNQSVNNILTKNAEYDSNGNLIRETTKQKEDFTFAGFLTDSNNLLINNTLGTSTLALQDYDKDGLLDRYERQVSLSDPENEDTDGDGKNDGDEIINYKTSPLVGIPNAADITTDDTVVTGSVPLKDGAATQTAKVINSNGDVIGTSTVNADGTFSVTIPKSSEGTYTIAIDSPNYDNDEVNTFEIIDVSKVPTPTINPVDDNDTEVVVNGTANATITVKDQDDNVIGTVTIPADGSSASIKLDQPLKAGTVLTSTASKNGKTSDVSDQVVVTDDTAPEVPTVNDVTSDDTTISGKAEPGSTVKVTFPDGTTATGTTDGDGNYTIDIPSNVDLQGGEELPVTATDKDGNESEPTTATVTDTTAPETPTVNDVTSDDTTISGKAEPGSTVKVTFPDGTTATGTTDEDGNYTIDIPSNVDLQGGEELPVTATDKDGNESEPATATVTDTTAPEAPTVNDVTSDDTTISGKAEPGSTVKVTFPDGTTAEGTADEDGNYTIDIPSNVDLKGGEELPITATDSDGNESEPATATVTDTTAPEAPTVNDVTSDDTTISGKAEPGSTVKVTFPDGTTAEGTTDEGGNYTIDIPSNVDLQGGEELPVTATDKDGNTSEPATVTVTDTTAPEAPTVNDITSDDTTISGKAEPGSTVKVTFPDGTTATGTTDKDGNYTIDIPSNVDLKGGEELPVTSTDKDGNESDPATATVTDTTAPEAPTVDDVTSDDTTISGKAEPGSTVKVTFPDGTTAEGTVDEDGNYTIDIPSNVDLQGGEELPVTATDKDGNESEPATTTVTDTTAPEAPTVNDITSDDTTISGKAEPGSTVTVTFPDGTTATGTADEEGNYTIDIPSNIDLKGGEELPVTSTDKDGNESDPTTTTVTDTTAPTVPTVNPITSDDTTISGKAEPGSTVKVTFPDGTTAEGTADEDGNYTIDIPSNVDLQGGEELPVTATDKDGNTSEPATATVTDTTAPEAPTVNNVTSDDTTISGKAEPGSTVTVTFPDGTTATGTTDADGNYTIDIPSNVDLQGGEELPVTATDKDGNESEPATMTVTDTTAPEAPTVNDITSDDTTISGKAEPGSTVKVTFPDGTTAEGTTDADGNYTIDIPSNVDLQGGEELPVTATDSHGNESEPATATVTDTTAPETPTVNDVTSDDTTISGKAEPGSTVKVTFPDGTTATGTTDADGNYTIDIPSNVDLQGGEELPVTATDKDGNESDPATATVTDTTAPEAPTVNDVTSDDTN
jgi:hypothetical protein